MLKGNAIVGQSGGPTAAINATLSGVIRGALDNPAIDKVFGAFNGVEGILKETFRPINDDFAAEEALRLLENTPAAALGSCRLKLPKQGEGAEVYEKLFDILKKNDIRYFFYIGGNDSMDTVHKVSAYAEKTGYEMRVMGVPKTIDNDVEGTDHTPGYGSAAKYIAASMQEMARDCAIYTVKAVTIVEIMGRDAGWLAASAALPRIVGAAGPDLVYLPESTFSYEEFYADVRALLEKKPNVLIAVSEGIRTCDGKYVGEGTQSGATDAFGHKYLSGTGKTLELAVKNEIGCKVRSVELNILQRCASHIASKTDLDEGVVVGRAAVSAAVSGESGKMMCFRRTSSDPYRVETFAEDISKIANKVRRVPSEFINDRANNVTDECLKYILPLIQGESEVRYENGLPKHLVIGR
ncbi:MAG: 6-phosphofructokinase [Eubacteriales bacterium]